MLRLRFWFAMTNGSPRRRARSNSPVRILFFYPTAIGNIVGEKEKEGDWHDAWETVMRGHAIANSLYVVAVNRTGTEDKLKFWGQSFVCDAFGKIIKKSRKKKKMKF